MAARRRILMAQPHPVTLTGGLVHFQTDVDGLITDVHKFVEAHPEMGLTDYRAVIE